LGLETEMKYTINGMIAFSEDSRLELGSKVGFVSPSKASVTLSSQSADRLSVSIEIEADSDTAAKELAQFELTRVSDLLSFHYSIGVSRSGITGMSSTTSSGGQAKISLQTSLSLSATVCATYTMNNKKKLATLVSRMKQGYSYDVEEVMFRWREAISNESSALRYLLLYRLLELLFVNDTRALTSWIKNRDPNVQLVSDRQRGEITMYTALRDHIHPKEKVFPIREIEGNVGKLQTLVHQRIEEKYQIQ
jgi:hypothetical protein